MLEAHYVPLVRNTFPQVFSADGGAADIFYERLFALAPSLRDLFGSDLSTQKVSLVGALEHALSLLDDRDGLRDMMQQLGKRHDQYGVMPETYDLAGAALLHTVKSRMGDTCTKEIEAAWTAAYASIASEMLTAHGQTGR